MQKLSELAKKGHLENGFHLEIYANKYQMRDLMTDRRNSIDAWSDDDKLESIWSAFKTNCMTTREKQKAGN